MPNFDLIAFDLDGTVFPSPTKPETTPRVEQALRRAHDLGALVVVASGRPSWFLGDQLLQASWLDWRILTNGARVSPSDGSEPDHVTPIPHDVALDLLARLSELGGTFGIHTDRTSYMERRKAELLARESQRLESEDTEDEDRGDAIDPRRINPIDAMAKIGKMDIVESAHDLLATMPDCDLDKFDCSLPDEETTERVSGELGPEGYEVARLGPTEIEVSLAGVTKGAALGWLCAHLGIDERRAVAFGDSGNDLSMTGRDLTFVAMGNASDEIKAAADDECDSVFRDGVANWLEEHL